MAFSWNPFARRQSGNNETTSDILQNNSNFGIFSQVNNSIEQAVMARSIINQNIASETRYTNPTQMCFNEDGILAMPIASSKAERIAQYRTMAKYSQTQWCLDEIADDFINEDEYGNIINLILPQNNEKLNKTRKDILQNEFRKYIGLFNLKDEGCNLIKRFLVEGELAWENVINKDYLSKGIVGIRFLPTEYYETLVDIKQNKPIGIMFDTKKMSRDISEVLSNTYAGSAQVFNSISPTTYSSSYNTRDCVVMLWPQLTYINSGEYSPDGKYVSYPMIEKAKQAYYQLTLLQDAAVILRVTRAPERLLFNVSTGKMTQNYADEYVRNFANSLKAKKVATPNGADIQSTYNPVTMLENYIFGKSDGNDGTTIESVTSTAQYDQIEDIKYFFKLYVKQFKVPFSRFEQPENAKPADGQIPQEEFSFLQQEVRLQRRFAAGFKRGFITHLKLRDIWEKYELTESDIDVEFVRPLLYDLYNKQKIVETKMNAYKAIVDNDEFSKTLAMKKILGYSDDDIEQNFKDLIKEKCIMQVADYWSGKIGSDGPGGIYGEPPIPIKGSEESKEESNSDEESSDENSSDEEESSSDESSQESETPPEEPSEVKPPEQTFGLG